jgi:hypothetical protein
MVGVKQLVAGFAVLKIVELGESKLKGDGGEEGEDDVMHQVEGWVRA